MNPAISVLVTAPADVAMRKNPLIQVDLETNRNLFFRIEFLLLTLRSIMSPWTSVPYIWRWKWRDYVVAEEGYRFFLRYCWLSWINFVLCSNAVQEDISVVPSRYPLSFLFLSIPLSIHQRRACFSNKDPDRQPDCYLILKLECC